MRRRLDIAMAMVRRPKVLFLDEPTAGLDPQGRRTLWALVCELRDQGSTVFLTTQNLAEADELAARVAIVHEGRIVAMGTPDDLKAQFGGATTIRVRACAASSNWIPQGTDGHLCGKTDDGWLTFTVEGGEAGVPSLLARLGAEGALIDRLKVRGPSLEDVFVNVTGDEIEASVDSGDAASMAIVRRVLGALPGSGR